MERVVSFRLELQNGPGRHARLSLLQQRPRRNGCAGLLLLRANSSVLGSRRIVDDSHRTQATRAARRWLRRRQRFASVSGEKRVVFLAILAVARMGIWMTQKKGLYDGANFSHRDLILYFRHQFWVKIRCDRKLMDRITFNRRWVHAASLVVQKGVRWSYPSFFLRMATTDRILRYPTPGK